MSIPGNSLARLFVAATLLLSACSMQPYHPVEVDGSEFLQRGISQEKGHLTVVAAVPNAAEAKALSGLDLYRQGIQPVWLEITNRGERSARLSFWSIDRNYFSPIEVAYMNRHAFSGEGYREMERWFHQNGLERQIPSGETRSGFIFTNYRPGTKAFNFDIFSRQTAYSFTFFVPIPGFDPDYMKVDFQDLYTKQEQRDLNREQFARVISEELACCADGPDGEAEGAPFNIVMIGPLRRALLRGQWLETATSDPTTAHARRNLFRGRPPDGIFLKDRADGNERIDLRVWLAPWTLEGSPIWLAQAVYGTEDTNRLLEFFTPDSPAADLDSAVHFVLQNFWYNQSLMFLGYLDGVPATSREQPAVTFDGQDYFTDGSRLIVMLSDDPVPMSKARVFFAAEPLAQRSQQ